MQNRIHRMKGFTLLELLVSIGVLGLISAVIAQIIFTTVKMNQKTENIKEMKQTAAGAMETMVRMVQSSQDILTTCDGSASESLDIINPGGGQTTFTCQKDTAYGTANIYRIASVGADLSLTYLTSGNVGLVKTTGYAGCHVSPGVDPSLWFTCTPVSGKTKSVNIYFRIRPKNISTSAWEETENLFQSTVVTRNN